MKKVMIGIALWNFAMFALAGQPSVPSLGGRGQFDPFAKSGAKSDTYRIGDEWGKKPVTAADLEQNPELKRIALATAKLRRATSFYLGIFENQHILVTNHHVCPDAASCLNIDAYFPLLNVRVHEKFLGTWTSIDLALMVIEFPTKEDEAKLTPLAGNFDFKSKMFPGQELITVGFGVGSNPMQKLVANQDSDCKVFSGENEFKFMADPDELNPGPYKAWSFANGCDVSHGDSGSAMVDRATGRVIGIIWTGKIPKDPKVQDSSYLDTILANGSPDIWTELSYGVPAQKIEEKLIELSQDQTVDAATKQIFTAILK